MERTENSDNNDRFGQPQLPHAIISQRILSRLPVETIYYYRSVCKLWCSFPWDPEFVAAHLRQSCQAPKFLVMSYRNVVDNMHTLLSFYVIEVSGTGNVARLMLTVRLEVDIYSMEPSVDGLICFSAELSKKVYVCNPSTLELLQLPEVDSSDARSELAHLRNMGSSDATSVLAGFGFDSSTRTYKVLRALVSEHCVKWFIYTLGSGDDNWRKLDQKHTPVHRIQPGQNAYIGGVVHWIFQGSGSNVPCGILTFDFRDEMFRVLPLPSDPLWTLYLQCHALHAALHLKVIGGYLRLIAVLDGSRSGIWALCCWALRDYTSHEWIGDFSFYTNILDYHRRLHMPVPVDIHNEIVIFSFGSKLYYTDGLRRQRGIAIEINDGIPEENGVLTVKHYQANFVESLIPIKYNIWH